MGTPVPMTKIKTKAKAKAKTRAKAKANTRPKAKTRAKANTRPKAKSAPPTRRPTRAAASRPLAYRLRRSPVHGSGLFATRTIPKGEMIIEYVGERISHDEADRRHADKAIDDNHTWLFTIDAKIVIDAGVGGNDSRFINHSCDPNCEVIVVDGRPMVEAIRTVNQGEELAYDYNLTRAPEDSFEVEKLFSCRCGAATCRGTMLAPPKKPKVEPQPQPKAKRAGARKRPVVSSRTTPASSAR